MTIISQELGYREISRLAEFILKIAEKGLGDDVPEVFSYDSRSDYAVCTTKKGFFITSDDPYFDDEDVDHFEDDCYFD